MFHNKQICEEYATVNKKRHTMHSSNLISDVPQEILQIYSSFLDLKSNVMFNATCTRSSDKNTIKIGQHDTLCKMFGSISCMITGLHDIFGTIQGQNKLLATMLRRMIYISVSDIPSANDVPYVSSRTLSEYHKIMRLTMERMDISGFDFNNLLEDVQFEYRGFVIVNISKERREQLDMVKEVIQQHYFSHEFTIYTYTTFGNIFLEFQCDKEKIKVDIHERLENDIFSWSFLADTLQNFVLNNPEHKLVASMKQNNIEITNSMITWDKGNLIAPYIISELVNELTDCSSIFKGSDDNIVEVWNDTIDVNWLLKDIVTQILNNGFYTFILKDATNSVPNDFYSSTIDEIDMLL